MKRIDEPVARRATALLVAIAAGDHTMVHQYYGLLFDLLAKVALRRGRFMAADVAQRLGSTEAGSATIHSSDLETTAYDAAKLALWRAVAAARRFDPARGDGASWALGNLGTAYYDTARAQSGARRRYTEVATDIAELEAAAPWASDPALEVEARDGLDWALSTLKPEERAVILARLHYGMAYREIAAEILGDERATKRVDTLLQSARAKLAKAHEAWLDEP